VKSSGQIPFAVIAGPPQALPPNSLIRIRGLPEGLTPSEGHRWAAGSWDVPLSAAPRLKLNVPEGLSGRMDFVVMLVDGRGTMLAESSSALVVGVAASRSVETNQVMEHAALAEIRRADEARQAERRKAEDSRLAALVKRAEEVRLEVEKVEAILEAEEARKAAEAEQARRAEEARKLAQAKAEEAKKVAVAAASRLAVSALPEQRHDPEPTASNPAPTVIIAQPTQSERLFGRGERYLTEGNIVVARQYFLRAAQMGHTRAAFKLAETYDPYVPELLNAHGVNKDLAEAKRWYALAVELGAEDAKARLAQFKD
jgi:hypothetical protein